MAPPLPWVILGRMVRRIDDEDAVLRGYGSFELARPPNITFLALPATTRRGRDGAAQDGNSRRAAAAHGDALLVSTPRGDSRYLAIWSHSLSSGVFILRGGESHHAVAPRGDYRYLSTGSHCRSTSNGVSLLRGDDFHHAVAPRGDSSDIPDDSFVVLATDRYAGLLLASSADITPLSLGETTAAPGMILPHGVRRSRPSTPIARLGNLGLISFPGRDGCLVAELHHVAGSDRALLITVRSDSGEWVEKDIPYPVATMDGAWSGHGVLSHDGKLWWIDLCRGIICCDPCEDVPTLVFEKIPDGSVVVAMADLGFSEWIFKY